MGFKVVNRREFLDLGFRGALGVLGAPLLHGRASRSRPPNVIFILADDLGWGDVGCYGQQKIRTPNIDRLAAEGMRFTDAYAGCTMCTPSRSSLMTGLNTGHTTVRANLGGGALRAGDITVAQVLKASGYATGCFGKWGLGDLGTTGVPNLHGFDEFLGYLNTVHAHLYYTEFLYKNCTEYPLPGNQDHRRGTYSHDVIAGQTLDFIRRHQDHPFFCYAPFTPPHLEWLVPEDSLAEYKGKFPEYYFDGFKRTSGDHFAPQPYPLATYAAMITRMDRDIGRIMALLEELKIDDHTIVFFTSDNGAGLIPERSDGKIVGFHDFFRSNGPFRGMKSTFYEGGIREPSVVRWPGKVPAGVVSSHPWAFCDVLPTLAELAGAKAPSKSDGISILPTLLGAAAGRTQEQHEFLYWELPRLDKATGMFSKEIPIQGVRMGEWKAVRSKPGGPLELYNLKEDIGEKLNVAADSPQVIDRIEEYLKTARTEPLQPDEPTSNLWDTYWWSKSD